MNTEAYKGIIYRLWYKVVNNDIRTIESFYRYVGRCKMVARLDIDVYVEKYKAGEIGREKCNSEIGKSVDYQIALTMMEANVRNAEIVEIDRLMYFIEVEKERLKIVLAHECPEETKKLMDFLSINKD